MNEYTIEYQYARSTGKEVIYADDDEQAIAKLWERLRPYMTLSGAYRHADIVRIVEGVGGEA